MMVMVMMMVTTDLKLYNFYLGQRYLTWLQADIQLAR